MLLDLKEDIREECEKLGGVTNVVLYDGEADGIVSVKFADTESAKACIAVLTFSPYYSSCFFRSSLTKSTVDEWSVFWGPKG